MRKIDFPKFSLRVRLTFLVSVELVVSVLLALGSYILLNNLVKIESYWMLLLALVVFSLLVGSFITSFLAKWFFYPIRKMIDAMGRVAEGDFNVQLETNSTSQEMRKMFSGFNLMTKELRATEILQTDFVSNVSHELKTPISAIEGYAMLLQNYDGLNADQRNYVDKILFNTKRLSSLAGNVLLLSRVDSQAIKDKQTKFRLDEQIRQSIVLLEPEWSKKDIEFDVDMEDVEYVGSENLMYHVWDNLIGNAIKFNPQGGMIRVQLLRTPESIRFIVEDSGPGIASGEEKHIFDKFYQGDSSHREEGNGLGLALAKQIVTMCGGSISAENIPGGSRFTVVLKVT